MGKISPQTRKWVIEKRGISRPVGELGSEGTIPAPPPDPARQAHTLRKSTWTSQPRATPDGPPRPVARQHAPEGECGHSATQQHKDPGSWR